MPIFLDAVKAPKQVKSVTLTINQTVAPNYSGEITLKATETSPLFIYEAWDSKLFCMLLYTRPGASSNGFTTETGSIVSSTLANLTFNQPQIQATGASGSFLISGRAVPADGSTPSVVPPPVVSAFIDSSAFWLKSYESLYN